MNRSSILRGTLLAGSFLTCFPGRDNAVGGDGPESAHPFNPPVVAASAEPQQALKSVRVPQGLRLELYAAEPLVANPVAFGFDERGRLFVTETFRLHKGVTDNRQHMNWLDDDLASRTVADRVAMNRKYLGKEFADYGMEHDRIRLVEDRDGDGRADSAVVFADGGTDALVRPDDC